MTKNQQTAEWGSDIGNYSAEIHGENFSVLQPSIIEFRSTSFNKTDEKIETAVDNIFDNLKVHIKSDNNKLNDFYYVGKSAINYGGNMARTMDITSNLKSESDIPIIMLSSLFAAKCIQDKFKTLDSTESFENIQLSQSINLVTAIPASEYTTDRAERLEKRLKGKHTVTVYFANTSARVDIEFENVKVTEEGKTAMLYLSTLTEKDKEIAFKKYTETYKKQLVIDDELRSLHVDIGNGTTEFTFIVGLNPVSSRGIRKGIGHAIENAINVYKDRLGGVDIDRQSFNEILMSNSKKAAFAAECLIKSLQEFSKQLMADIKSSINSLTKGQMDILFIHGGGSIMLESDQYKNDTTDTADSEKGKEDGFYEDLVVLTEGMLAEVAYVNEDYSAHLNARGCYELAKVLYRG